MRTAFILFAALLFTAACNDAANDSSSAGNPAAKARESQAALKQLMDSLSGPPQRFTIDGRKPSVVKGAKGTTLYVDPADLEGPDGRAPQGAVTVELKELLNQSELALAGAQTVSDGLCWCREELTISA